MEENKRKKCMIYTPNIRIPIGAVIRRPDGSRVLRIKNARTGKEDDITLEGLLEAVAIATKE